MSAKQTLTLQVPPEQVGLFQGCYEALGYKLDSARPQEHADTELRFTLENEIAWDGAKFAQCENLLGRLETMNRQCTRYYLHVVCGVGLAGAICLGLSFLALRAGAHGLFVALLLLGLFGCTITLYLRPAIYGLWMRKYGTEVPSILSELETLLGIKLGRGDK